LALRNGHLNQMAYSLFLFIRDVAGGDLVAWIDEQLEAAANAAAPDRNFLHRTGILRRLAAEHAYGPACYGADHCVGVIGRIAAEIDARQFNRHFPKFFPRFVQHAIWRYCSGSGLDICNGNTIDDRLPCANSFCRLYSRCDRIALKTGHFSEISH
jgi:hypothetical protein